MSTNLMNRLTTLAVLATACFIFTTAAYAVEKVSANSKPVYSTQIEGLAIHGYDPVAYFTEGKPVEGKPELTHEWRGGKWQFSSAENRDAFIADPVRYAPQYGGWCAYAMSQGFLLSTDPASWTVYEDKLYLNTRQAYTRFLGDIPGYVTNADVNWQVVEDAQTK